METSVLEEHSNKAHTGYLGHSYVGEGVNVGAMTVTSDLKNTYGTVRMEIDSNPTDSGTTKLGAFIADHAKISISTSIYAGKKYLPIRLVEFARGCRFKCDFCAIQSFFHSSHNHRSIDQGRADCGLVATQHQDLVELDRLSGLGHQFLDGELVTRRNPVLLAAGLDDCEHHPFPCLPRPVAPPLNIWRGTSWPVPVASDGAPGLPGDTIQPPRTEGPQRSGSYEHGGAQCQVRHDGVGGGNFALAQAPLDD